MSFDTSTDLSAANVEEAAIRSTLRGGGGDKESWGKDALEARRGALLLHAIRRWQESAPTPLKTQLLVEAGQPARKALTRMPVLVTHPTTNVLTLSTHMPVAIFCESPAGWETSVHVKLFRTLEASHPDKERGHRAKET